MTQERAVSTVKCSNIPVDSTCFNHHLLRSKWNCFVSETVQIRPSAVEHRVSPGWMRARGIHGRVRLKAQLTDCHRAFLRGYVFVKMGFRIVRKKLSVRLGHFWFNYYPFRSVEIDLHVTSSSQDEHPRATC